MDELERIANAKLVLWAEEEMKNAPNRLLLGDIIKRR